MKKEPVDVPKLEMLYRLYEQEMYRVCVAVLGDSFAAEDAVSESFLKLIRIRDGIRSPDSPETRHLCIKTARNTAINMYRKRQREAQYYEGLPDVEKGAEEFQSEELEAGSGEAKREVLSCLSDKYRIPAELVYFEGLSTREAAAVLKISEPCVRKRLERARQRLKARLEKR